VDRGWRAYPILGSGIMGWGNSHPAMRNSGVTLGKSTAIPASKRGGIGVSADKKTTRKFEQKRIDILDAAAALINSNGVRAMTFADVARHVGLNTTSVTYYFKRKELLAAAAFHQSLDRIETMVNRAAQQPDPQSRCDAYIAATFERMAAIREERERPMAILSDIRALDDPIRQELGERYIAIFNKVRGFFEAGEDAHSQQLVTARTHVFMENLFWLPAWIQAYSVSDYPRVEARFREIFNVGIAKPGSNWTADLLTLPDAEAVRDDVPEDFLRSATVLINERGYRGASVDRIAAELNVTKGSFYHYLDAKDDLVLACFERSYARVSAAQQAAMAGDAHPGRQIASAIATLLDIQFYQPFPLLRSTALQALPSELRADVIDRSNRMARRFAGMMIDGITEGSIRAIDPLIASQMMMAGLNAAFELRRWAEAMDHDEAIRIYASTLAFGVHAPM
jgi:AcrR family transcriptional regulator